jgi:hypothetical protein
MDVLLQATSQWPRGLSRRSSAAGLLGLRVRILPGAWMTISCVLCYQIEISATGRYLVQRVCVCVCVRAIRCNNNSLHLQRVGVEDKTVTLGNAATGGPISMNQPRVTYERICSVSVMIIETGTPHCSEKKLLRSFAFHHEPHEDCTVIELGPPQ